MIKKNGSEILLGKVVVADRKKATQRGLRLFLKLKRMEERAKTRAKEIETKRRTLEALFVDLNEDKFSEGEPVGMTVKGRVEKVDEKDYILEITRGERTSVSWKVEAMKLAKKLKYKVTSWAQKIADANKSTTFKAKVY